MSRKQRDMVYVLLGNIKVDANGCFLWQKQVGSKGYGMTCCNGKSVMAHRASYRVFRGEIPDGMFVCHRCDVRHCVNPAHLFLGTNTDNMRDCRDKKRHCFGESVHNSKLTEDQVVSIHQRYSSGEHAEDLAREFGVEQSWIYGIARGEKWTHLGLPKVERATAPYRARRSTKLSKQERLEVERLIQSGTDFKLLAEKFRVSTTRIYQIAKEIRNYAK